MAFDPDGPALGEGVFGLPEDRSAATVVLIPVPWEVTVSYGGGTGRGPEAIRAASAQVDLHDLRFGDVYEAGIVMEPEEERIRVLSKHTREAARPAIERGGVDEGDGTLKECIDGACGKMNAFVTERVSEALDEGKVPGVIGGEHAVSYGAIAACADRFGEIGILHLDAHLDLRQAYEGFAWSHASVMFNVLRDRPSVTRLVSVGIRDVGRRELELASASDGRCVVMTDAVLHDERADGVPMREQARRIVAALPERVYVSFDIDGLDPSMCPHTGTPVPGGLGFEEACLILSELVASGRRIVGFDLVEVAPGPGALEGEAPEWDANVGARMLYRLCGAAVRSRG